MKHTASLAALFTACMSMSQITAAQSPDQLEQGDLVIINRDFVPHTATALGDDAVTAQRQWSTEELSQHANETLTFTREMAGMYYCRYHPGMTALLISTDG